LWVLTVAAADTDCRQGRGAVLVGGGEIADVKGSVGLRQRWRMKTTKEENDKGGGGGGDNYCPSFTASKDRV
jgi:hypothetical protein